jgi:hypothetical protein
VGYECGGCPVAAVIPVVNGDFYLTVGRNRMQHELPFVVRQLLQSVDCVRRQADVDLLVRFRLTPLYHFRGPMTDGWCRNM